MIETSLERDETSETSLESTRRTPRFTTRIDRDQIGSRLKPTDASQDESMLSCGQAGLAKLVEVVARDERDLKIMREISHRP